jgi:tRNA A-37 threonylcarbamoyl transferase component Bud32
MPILQNLSVLALRQFVHHACTAVGLHVGMEATDKVSQFLSQRFRDHSLRLVKALETSNGRAWQVLEISLADDSFWARCRLWLAPREEVAFREQVRTLLSTTTLDGLTELGPDFRRQCHQQLRGARKAALLTAGSLHPSDLARQAGEFARFAEPERLLEAERQVLDRIAAELAEAGFPALARYVSLQTSDKTTLLASAVRYFFRRQVESDRELFQGLAFAQLESLGQNQEDGFATLGELLGKHGDRLDEALEEIRGLTAQTHDAVTDIKRQQEVGQAVLTQAHEGVLEIKRQQEAGQTVLLEARGDVLDIKSELERQGQQLQELGQAVLQALEQHRLPRRELRPGDSLSISSDGERQLVRSLMARFRSLPEQERQRVPALLNGLGLLETAAGEFDAARRDFGAVAAIVGDPAAQAAALHNAFLAALEQRQFNEALAALQQAVGLAPERFAPFPTSKYELLRILGAGGFGVAFLCKHRNTGSHVVVKALRTDGLDRAVSDVFREARVLEELDHPAIIRLRDCDFADAACTRPFIVMEYFEALTLADHVDQHGPFAADDLVAVARPVAEALQAAHERGILHRDVKPANLLVRRDAAGWRVKVIDFGLATKRSLLAAASQKTVTGYSIAGTRDYAAPEQLGLLAGVSASPASDVYGFGKTCCFALFKTCYPLRKHWGNIPGTLADLLEHCLAEAPADRPSSFAAVLEKLRASDKAAPPSTPPPSPRDLPAEPVKANPPIPPAPYPVKRPAPVSTPPLPSGKAELHCFRGHKMAVTCVAFRPDGRSAVSGGREGAVRLWDLEARKERHRFSGHGKAVGSVAFFPDGSRVISASADGTVRLWDTATGKEVRCFDQRGGWSVALSPDGKSALSADGAGTLRLWNMQTGAEIRCFRGHSELVRSVAFSPDGNRALSSGRDQTVRLWDVQSGRQLLAFRVPQVWLTTIGFTPDGRRALTANGHFVSFWDLATGQESRPIQGHNEDIPALAVSPDGRRVLCGSVAQTVRLWDVETGQELACMTGHQGEVSAVAFSPDGKHALSGGEDRTVRLWSLPPL